MAAKELFNGNLKTTLGDNDRIAVGVPGMEHCDNVLFSDLILQLALTVPTKGNIINADLTAGVWTYNHGKSTTVIELTLYDGNGTKQSVDGMLTIVNSDEIIIDFGGEIEGTWSYIFKYWNI